MAPITGKFEADFKDFESAVERSTNKLKALETQGDRVGVSMTQSMTRAAAAGQQGASSFTKFGTALDQADKTLSAAGVRVGTQIGALKELGNVAGKTAAQVGAIGTAGLVVGTAIAAWDFGRMIAGWLGTDEAIANATASLLGWGTAADQVAGAQADELAKASAKAGRAITDLAEARRINTAAAAADTKAAQDAAKAYEDWKKGVEAINGIAINWLATLNTINGSVVEAIKFYLDAGISQEKLADAYGLTVEQINAVKQAMDAEKVSTDAVMAARKQLVEIEQHGRMEMESGLLGLSKLEQTLSQQRFESDLKAIAAIEAKAAAQKKYQALLDAEVEAAKNVNEIRNLGIAPRDIGLEAAQFRDRGEAAIAAQAAVAGKAGLTFDEGPLRQKLYQDMDALLGILTGDRAAGVTPLAAAPPVTVNVSGVFDPRTINELTTAISDELIRRTGRKF